MTLERLFDEHHASLFRFLARMTGDAEFAQDLVQDTFLALAKRPLPRDVPHRAWLFGVAHNLARSGMRKRWRRQMLLHSGRAIVPLPAEPPRPDTVAEREQLRTLVRNALDSLNERERTMLLMREEGFKHREIAAALGTTTASVGTMLARAMSRLGDRLTPLLEVER